MCSYGVLLHGYDLLRQLSLLYQRVQPYWFFKPWLGAFIFIHWFLERIPWWERMHKALRCGWNLVIWQFPFFWASSISTPQINGIWSTFSSDWLFEGGSTQLCQRFRKGSVAAEGGPGHPRRSPGDGPALDTTFKVLDLGGFEWSFVVPTSNNKCRCELRANLCFWHSQPLSLLSDCLPSPNCPPPRGNWPTLLCWPIWPLPPKIGPPGCAGQYGPPKNRIFPTIRGLKWT